MKPLLVREALSKASSFLSEHGIEEARLVAEYLIRAYMKWDRTQFVLRLSEPLSDQDWTGIRNWLERCARGEPVQYITGEQDFYGETFLVAPGVLIPRPETEILVQKVLEEADRLFGPRSSLRVLDLGTGSGAIALTLAKLRPHWQVVALDRSGAALEIARKNAQRLGVADRVVLVEGDMLRIRDSLPPEGREAFSAAFDVIVSNPPYIPTQEIATLDVNVRDYEPHLALDGGEDGLRFYRGIAAQLGEWLNAPGLAAFEVGWGQSGRVVEILERAGAEKTATIRDFQGIERVVLGFFLPKL